MEQMTIDQINNLTRSEGVVSTNCVYRATSNTIAIDDIDNDPSTPGSYLQEVKKGDLFVVLGCGQKHRQFDKSGNIRPDNQCTTAVNIDGELMWIPNKYIEHYANHILMDIEDMKKNKS